MLGYLMTRFWYLGPVGKAVTVIAALYGTGWILGMLGWYDLARQLGSAALSVLAALLTLLAIRWVWTSFTGKPGQ